MARGFYDSPRVQGPVVQAVQLYGKVHGARYQAAVALLRQNCHPEDVGLVQALHAEGQLACLGVVPEQDLREQRA